MDVGGGVRRTRVELVRQRRDEAMEVHNFEADGPVREWLGRLCELALNLRWTWDRETRALFRDINPALWDQTEDNPWMVLRATSRNRLEALSRDTDFCARIDAL